MALTGKGFFIWQMLRTEGGDVNAIASLAQQSNYTHVLVKIADGTSAFNVDTQSGVDYVAPLISTLRARGIQVWGWHYVYGSDPVGEADIAIRRSNTLGLDGYVIDAEGQYKNRYSAAATFMTRLRSGLNSNIPVALCSYRYPSYHPQLPWQEFLEKCDLNMPQVYWEQSHNPGAQLTRCVNEFQGITPFRPIIPVGSAYTAGGWSPTAADITEFMQTAQALNLAAANFWEWYHTRTYLPADIWNTIAGYNWVGSAPPSSDIVQAYINALNTHDPNQVAALYHAKGVHVNAQSTVQGPQAIAEWYRSWFGNVLPNATFSLAGFTGSGSSRYFNWTARSSAGQVQNGADTFGLVDGKIAYHFSAYTLTR